MVVQCRTKLAFQPSKAAAVLFYNQHPDGRRDEDSLHGGCPVIQVRTTQRFDRSPPASYRTDWSPETGDQVGGEPLGAQWATSWVIHTTATASSQELNTQPMTTAGAAYNLSHGAPSGTQRLLQRDRRSLTHC
jgi:hypothetical protein